jgi:hypothetical protein
MSVAQVAPLPLPAHVALPASPSSPHPVLRAVNPAGPPPSRLLDRVRQALQTRHYSRRTEKAYVGWIIATTMIYAHVFNWGPAAVRSPADRMLGT